MQARMMAVLKRNIEHAARARTTAKALRIGECRMRAEVSHGGSGSAGQGVPASGQ
jgi:hypothetical protein